MGQATTAPGPWIVSARYDLGWFFGGALLSVAILAVYLAGAPILALWWGWLLFFDGPHIAAVFTRTYLDREEWAHRRAVLLASLLSFALGPVCLMLNVALGSPYPFLLFLAFAAFYGYYHVVRQHYGFLALYKAVDPDRDRRSFVLDKWILYLGCWAPYFYFLLSHPRARALLRLPADAPEGAALQLVLACLLGVWGLAVLTLILRVVSGTGPGFDHPKGAYLGMTLGLYSFIYFAVARMEPTYAESAGPDQDFLLISILITVFHNVQYIGLVWLHNRNRYAGNGNFGPARWLNRSPGVYLGGLLLFSFVVYLSFACWTGVFPRCSILPGAQVGPFTMSQIGLCLWWGLAIQHYVLDQKIWRLRGDGVLRRNLGLA